ncbi:MAG: hypothetical protein K6F84_04085, partial [Lachnospiraceae bacterium]|nr:hypothetical protein [Lachnospiraceae bacterium]
METLNAFHDEKMNKPELCGLRILLVINLFLIVTDFLMPQYFGVHIGWDITCTRLANMLLCGYCLFNPGIVGMFLKSSVKHALIVPVMAYLFVAAYTCVFRVDINAFVMVFLELLTMYMLVFGIRFVIGIRRTIRIIIGCAYFLGLYGMVEATFGYSLYLKFLKTVPTSVTNCYRSGHYRIMGPCGHPLGYGLLLLLFLAIACYDYDRDKIYIFKRPLLVGLL